VLDGCRPKLEKLTERAIISECSNDLEQELQRTKSVAFFAITSSSITIVGTFDQTVVFEPRIRKKKSGLEPIVWTCRDHPKTKMCPKWVEN
jgi:hypothetical protein